MRDGVLVALYGGLAVALVRAPQGTASLLLHSSVVTALHASALTITLAAFAFACYKVRDCGATFSATSFWFSLCLSLYISLNLSFDTSLLVPPLFLYLSTSLA